MLDEAGQTALRRALARIERSYTHFRDQFPTYGSGLLYELNPRNNDWMAGFWSGLLWLAYVATGDDQLREEVRLRLTTFEQRLAERVRLTHDLGFLYTLSARAQWQLAADQGARQIAMRAAQELYQRYNPLGGYIQAWGEVGDPDEGGRIIIDTMMNLPLLFWAATQTIGETQLAYFQAARQHALTSLSYLVREDGSTYHTFFLDPANGDPLGPQTHQGLADDSLWARGQAWAIYGFTLAAEWTGDDTFAHTAYQLAERFMAELPESGLPTWDLRLTDGAPDTPDSSASAIAAGGMLRLARIMAAHGREWLLTSAHRLMDVLLTACQEVNPNGEGLLLHGVYNLPGGVGVDQYTIFGDYFYLETLLAMDEKLPDFWGPAGQE